MTDMIAGKDVSGSSREISKVDNLSPAHQKENASNQPPAEMGEQSLGNMFGGHAQLAWKPRERVGRISIINIDVVVSH
jgi:hypothetical protein